MRYFYLILILSCLFTGSSCENDSQEEAELRMVWNDEFDHEGAPNETRWNYDLGDGCPTLCGWGNKELQHFTKRSNNVRIEDGNLIIEVHKDMDDSLRQYSSARIQSRHKGDWKYGRVEVRAKMPTGIGVWPAVWMLPTEWKYGGWPKSGEIDIMEHVGFEPGMVHGSLHTEAYNHMHGTQMTRKLYVPDLSDEFHVYAVNWTAEKIEFLVDDQIYHTFSNNGGGTDVWPYDQPFYLILNVSVGGTWGGAEGVDDEIWPQKMIVDYVRVYQDQNLDHLAAGSEQD